VEKRKQLVRDIQLLILRESPSVFMIGLKTYSMTQPWVKNWRLMVRGNLNSMREWDEVWLDPIPRS
jgi:ABC-type transport system substrate-binding protein